MKSQLSFNKVLNSNHPNISSQTLAQIVQQYQLYPQNQYIISFAINSQPKQRYQHRRQLQQSPAQFDHWIASKPHLKSQTYQSHNRKHNIAPQLLKYTGSKKNLVSNKNIVLKDQNPKEIKKGKNMAQLCRQFSQNQLLNTKAVWKCKPEQSYNSIHSENADYQQQPQIPIEDKHRQIKNSIQNTKNHWIAQQKQNLYTQVRQLAQNIITQQKKNQLKGQESLLMDNDSMPPNNAWQATKNQISEYLKLKKQTKVKQQNRTNEYAQNNTDRQSFSAVGYSFAHDIIGKSGSNKSKEKIQPTSKQVTKFQGLQTEDKGIKIPNVNSVQSQQACGSKSEFGTKKRLSQSNNQHSMQQAEEYPNEHMAHYLFKQQKITTENNHEVNQVKIVESKLVISEDEMNSQMICIKMEKNQNIQKEYKQEKMLSSRETKKHSKKIIVVRHQSRLSQDKKSEFPLMFKKSAQKQSEMTKNSLNSQSKQNIAPPNKLLEKPKGLKVQTAAKNNDHSLNKRDSRIKYSQSINSKQCHGIRTSLKKNEGVESSVASSKDLKFDIQLQ